MSIPAATAPDAWPFDEFAGTAVGVDPPFVVDGPVGAAIRTSGWEVLNFASIGFFGLQQRDRVPGALRRQRSRARPGRRRFPDDTQGLSSAHRDVGREISRVLGTRNNAKCAAQATAQLQTCQVRVGSANFVVVPRFSLRR